VGKKTSEPSIGRRVRHRVEAALFQVAVWVAPHLPRGVVRGFADVMGSLGWAICAADRKVARANLDLAFGDTLSDARKKKIIHGTFTNLARTLFDLVWAGPKNRDKILKLVDFNHEQLDHIQELIAARKGVIFVLPHFGNWELGGLAWGLLGLQLTTIAEPGVNPHIDDMITDARRSTGHLIVPPRNSMLTMVRAAMRFKMVTLFIDVNARRGRGGIWVDFFGVPVYQSVAAAELALRSNGVIICGLTQNLPGGRLKVDFAPFIDSAQTLATDYNDRVRELTEKALQVYEPIIREHPEQWLWTYKRWKRRPTVERGRFPAYSRAFPTKVKSEAKTENSGAK
jgi:lauroyl/myristoyl acyltransferase